MTIEGERVHGRAAKALLASKHELASRLRLLTHAGNEALLSKKAAGDAPSLGRRDRNSVADRGLLSTWRTANAARPCGERDSADTARAGTQQAR